MPNANQNSEVKFISLRVRRFGPGQEGAEAEYDQYQVPWSQGMSAMDALDYVYQTLDGSLAYYDHAACALGVCGKCMAKINGKPGLLCQTVVQGDLTLEPGGRNQPLQDLVTRKTTEKGDDNG